TKRMEKSLSGECSMKKLEGSINIFHSHWEELNKHRKRSGTHFGAYSIAPYYFFFGVHYAAFAIELLPEAQRSEHRERLLEVILKTQEPDGTWNDMPQASVSAYATAMVVLCLLGPEMPRPPNLKDM
ncbi:MAG: hypothetical protein V3S24_01870, partial [Candidatus Tectomicrobia bacterium]